MLVNWHMALIPHLVLKSHLAVEVYPLVPLHQKCNTREMDALLEESLMSQVDYGLIPCFLLFPDI